MRERTGAVQTQSHNHHRATARPTRHHHHRRHHTSTSTSTPASSDTIHVVHHALNIGAHGSNASPARDAASEPARKKRRLSPRASDHKPLEAFGFSRTTQPKPPTKITRDEPHGPLQKTLNGVRSTLDVDENESLPPPVPTPVPKRVTRSPAPVPPAPTAPPAREEKQTKKKEEKRTLRSQDEGPRLKSELAVYFPNYEDVMFDVPAEDEDFLTVASTLYIADDTAKRKDGEPSPAKSGRADANGRRTSLNGSRAPATRQRPVSSMSNASPSVNLEFLAKTSSETPEDPLTDAHFLKSHNRAERKEKQLRNIERERAMHEKVQLDRLLDGLQGHDWLRVLGITGITDGEAKKYERKRKYFIAEVRALIGKFAQWKEQEKKLRLRKEAAQARLDAIDEAASTASSIDPPSSDLNASASRQLQQETVNAVKASTSKAKGRMSLYAPSPASRASTPVSDRADPVPRTMLPPSPEILMTSFYAKRHLRDAALSKSRSTARNVTAFGHPVPDLDEQEFALPREFVTPDALRSNARDRRRRKRESTTATK